MSLVTSIGLAGSALTISPYAAARYRLRHVQYCVRASVLRSCHAMSGTDVRHAPTSCYRVVPLAPLLAVLYHR
eukprot:1444569-Rhodomonas_salina.1